MLWTAAVTPVFIFPLVWEFILCITRFNFDYLQSLTFITAGIHLIVDRLLHFIWTSVYHTDLTLAGTWWDDEMWIQAMKVGSGSEHGTWTPWELRLSRAPPSQSVSQATTRASRAGRRVVSKTSWPVDTKGKTDKTWVCHHRLSLPGLAQWCRWLAVCHSVSQSYRNIKDTGAPYLFCKVSYVLFPLRASTRLSNR